MTLGAAAVRVAVVAGFVVLVCLGHVLGALVLAVLGWWLT